MLAFAEGANKALAFAGGVVKVLAFAEGAVKKVLASLEMCWHWLKDLFKMYRLINVICSRIQFSRKFLLAT